MPYDPFVAQLLDNLDDWFKNEDQMALARLTRDFYPYTALFSPIQINKLMIKNRVVMGPMGNISMVEEMGRPGSKMVAYFTERARGGVGLITSGLVPVSQGIDPTVTEPGDRSYFPRLDGSRTVLAGWRDLAESIHAYGSRFFIQLTPGLGRVGSPQVLMTKWTLPVSASWNPSFYMPSVPCRPLLDGECRQIIQRMGQAAADAKSLLIDGVYLHGHEGYLLEQMTNPAFNRRKLSHFADWQVFGIEMVEEIRKRVGPHYPIMYRIDLSLALNDTYGARMNSVPSLKGFKNERTVEMTLDYMLNLVKAGVDVFDVDMGCYDNWWLPHPPNSMPAGCYLAVSRLVKAHFAQKGVLSNAGVPVPVVAVGKLGYPDLAEKALRDDLCDMVMLARPLLADANWCNKAFAGQVGQIRPCIGDQEACINEFIEGGHPQCSVNPRTGFEELIPSELTPAARPLKVAVVGAGPAGITCAVTAARRGHAVSLFEKAGRVGGMLVAGSVPKIKYEVANYLGYLESELAACQKENGLQVFLNTPAEAQALKEAGFDALVVCTGGRPFSLKVPGAELPQVVQAVDLFRSPEKAQGAKQVVVIGGGAVGCECAHWLATEQGVKNVTVVEMLPYFMKGLCTANRTHLIHDLERRGVKLLNCTRLQEIKAGQVVVSRNHSSTVPDPYVTWTPLLPENVINPLARPMREELVEETLPADLVVMAAGLRPDDALYRACLQNQAAGLIYFIGDVFQIGRVFEAVKAGFAVGRAL
ncbi:MAG TPA: FAD-dependent oxidoreductase [Anaerolineaceae bacterium]|nr:FAD-dependent oxidoreductase [Anaerolineaceae bacterium]HPN51203.1 FAD-dependent oxidoreductase [Anaerolineaceae bacterium]